MCFWKLFAFFPIFLLAPIKPCLAAAQKAGEVTPAAKADSEKTEPVEQLVEQEKKQKEESKRWEARISPVATIVGWYTGEAAIHFNDHWALGPTFTAYAGSKHPFLIGLRGRALGFFTTYYLEALPASSWYLALRLQKQKYTSYPGNDSPQVIKHISGNTADLIAGYRQRMANNFFILAGAGLQRRKFKQVEDRAYEVAVESRKDRVVPYFEAKLGLDF